MEIDQFMWSSQTVVLPERDEQLRERSILNVKAEQFWKLFWNFHCDRFLCQSSHESHCKLGCQQVDDGDVMSDLFKSDEADDANFQFEGQCAMTTAYKKYEVQENVVRSLIRNSKF